MQFLNTKIKDCYYLETPIKNDNRGSFHKIYHNSSFSFQGLELSFKEQYFTVSNKNVLRGMHFQLPPYDNSKLITCLSGRVLDVILDLRVNSPSYMKYDSFELIGKNKQAILIPSGIAHGFISLEDNSEMLYSTTCEYDFDHDKGILWSSFGFDWPCQSPILSERDQNQVMANDFKSPFRK